MEMGHLSRPMTPVGLFHEFSSNTRDYRRKRGIGLVNPHLGLDSKKSEIKIKPATMIKRPNCVSEQFLNVR